MISCSDVVANQGDAEVEAEAQRAFEEHEYKERRTQWLRQGMTEEFLYDLATAQGEYEKQAKDLAMCDEAHCASRIRALLIQSRTLEKVIEYGRTTRKPTAGFSVA